MILVGYLCYIVLLIFKVNGSHFRGGIITWKSITPQQVQISYRVSFRTTYASNHFCDATTIKAGYLVNGENSLYCTYGCYGSIAPMSYYCTDFSAEEDWTTGQHSIIYKLPITSDNIFRFGYDSCCWIQLIEGGGSWKMETTADLSIRQDTGKINTSPISTMSPIVRVQKGCSLSLHIPTADEDNDVVKCRWATNSPRDECGGVCQKLSGSILQQIPCVLDYTASGTVGWYGVALQIEDFENSTSTQPFSSVSLQFLLYVFESPAFCQSKPVVNTNGNPPIVQIVVNASFFQTIVANSGSTSISITAINTISPTGMTKSELYKVRTDGTEWYVNVSWTPSNTQGGSHIFCYWAVNSNGQSSEQVCQTLYVVIMCLDPGTVLNAVKTQTGNIPNDIITYQCNTQYELTSGNLLRTCQNNGTWSGTAPTCTIVCLDPDVVFNAAKTQTGDNPNDTITYQCNLHYKLSSGNLVRTCQNKGTWSGTAPTCSIMCSEPAIANNSVWNQTVDNGEDIVTYACNSQFEVVTGNFVPTCHTVLNWNVTTPICIIMCPPPDDVVNVNKTVYETNLGKKIDYDCYEQFEVASDILRTTCQTNGLCDESTLICTIMCPLPEDIPSAQKIVYGNKPGETVVYKCNKQHEVKTGNLTRACQANGVWDGDPPVCTIMCPEPIIVNNSVLRQTGDNPGDTVTYACNYQYEVTFGDLVQTCQKNGNWNGTTPICTIMCPEPEDVYKANKTYTGYNPDDNVTYICEKEENNVIGTYTGTCLINGTWNSIIPGCLCDPPPVVSNAVWERNGSTAYLNCNDGFYSKGNLQIHCSINSSWTSLTDKCYKESSYDFIIVASVISFGVLSALTASGALLFKRKPKQTSDEM